MKQKTTKIYFYTICICITLVIGSIYYFFFSDISNKETVQYLYIDTDDTQDSVFTKLTPMTNYHAMAGFRTLARHSDYAKNIHTGRYAIAPDEGALVTFRHLKNGVQSPISLTIPEARTMERLAELLSRKLMLDSTSIASALKNQDFCSKYGYDTTTIAAIFIPNTYNIYWNISIDNLLKRMKKEHNSFWNAERLKKAEAMDMNTTEVATMASIVDEETANNGEKPMIAGMYYNRIKAGMPLQADPTIKFAWKDFSMRRIYHKSLFINSPYNTYKNTGLPPGPIKIASIAGIDAVLNHTKHDYLYMCAKEDFSGTHNFAQTYEEHLKNAAKYSDALNKRGIK